MTLTETKVLEYADWLRIAYNHARNSPDLSTQNGAIILDESDEAKYSPIIAWGCNTLPDGCEITPARLERPAKYLWTEHAERNAIYCAARLGARCDGATMVCPWFACADCGRAIIQAGVKRVVGHKKMFDETPERWKESIENAWTMFREAGIETILVEGALGLDPIRFNEALWRP